MKCIPSPLKPFVRKCYYAFLLIKSKVSYFIEMLGPTERIIKYLGFNVYYSKGTSLIQRVKRDGQYEPEITQILLKEVCQKPKAAFLDIGANIGLISLNIHSVSPSTPIYAFEPGPHQAEYFQKTIKENNLTSKIDFYPIALSDEEGVCDFAVHDSKHASGDGFVDTGRAGTSKIIKVQTKKLDNWWDEHKCPEVGVIKIDTEGAELMVFKGGDNLIKTQKPTIFLEMQDVNLKKYPYDAYDILNWFNQRNYQVYTLAGDLVNKNNLANYLLSEEMYCARFDAKD